MGLVSVLSTALPPEDTGVPVAILTGLASLLTTISSRTGWHAKAAILEACHRALDSLVQKIKVARHADKILDGDHGVNTAREVEEALVELAQTCIYFATDPPSPHESDPKG